MLHVVGFLCHPDGHDDLALAHNCLDIVSLVEWFQDEAQWPTTRDLSTFLEWFAVEVHSMVLDVAEGELAVVVDDS